MPLTPENLLARIEDALGEQLQSHTIALGELTIEVSPGEWLSVCTTLRDADGLAFDSMIDLCGVDYSTYEGRDADAPRFAVVLHLRSVRKNNIVRVRTFCADDAFPMVASVSDVWPVANWFEREAFDMFGILFEGHPDLRRILADYGFVGHPFRKDFPISGHVEMRYDPDQRRVIYQPVSIEPREVTPRIVREANYGDVGHG